MNVVTQTHTHTHNEHMYVLAYSLFDVLGFALKNALPSSSDGSHSKKLLEIFLALFFLTMRGMQRRWTWMGRVGGRLIGVRVWALYGGVAGCNVR